MHKGGEWDGGWEDKVRFETARDNRAVSVDYGGMKCE